MDSIFGQKIVMNEENVRSNVWKIQALAYKLLVYGCINIGIIFVSSFYMPSFIITIIISAIFGGFTWYRLESLSNKYIGIIKDMVSEKAYKPNTAKEFSDDITEDKSMIIAMRTIRCIYMFGFILILMLSIFVFILSLEYLLFNFNCLVFFLPWVFMGLLMTKQAELGAEGDFSLSLNGGLEKLALTETTRISRTEG